MTIDKDLLFKPRLPEEDVEVPGVGTVRVRGLNRLEAMHVQAAKGPQATEVRILALGMVAPSLTEDEVRLWQQASAAGEIEAVSTRIAVLSGMAPDSDKESYKSLRDGTDAGVRALPGPEAGDDGGPATPGNAG